MLVVGARDVCDMGVTIVFFQAEDGIRDLVRSRGLGDVYKRQEPDRDDSRRMDFEIAGKIGGNFLLYKNTRNKVWTVSYTHLTLPTSDLV